MLDTATPGLEGLNLPPETLRAIIGAVREQVVAEMQPTISDLHTLAAQAASNNDPSMRGLLDQQPKSHPEGWRPGMPNAKQHQGEAKLKAIAESRGGIWHQNEAVRHYPVCEHRDPTTCTLCWTPEEEARYAYAVGLTKQPGPALYPEEEPGSARPNAPTVESDKARVGRHNRRTQ